MHENSVPVRRALISVSDKTGIIDLARHLHDMDIEILSTGGTAKHLRENNIPVTDVSAITHFPEIMDGRVKTLHPAIHGGILGLRDVHTEAARENGIDWIDLVIVNLYPFANTIKRADVTLDEALENIDIGGPSMIRSAAKNTGWVGVVVDPADYATVASELKQEKSLSFSTRKKLAAKAFAHTAQYDAVICDYLAGDTRTVSLKKSADLRYGENPHQSASAWRFPEINTGVLAASQWQGKPLSYNNLVDADAAFACVREFLEPACVIVKHATPCGVATDSESDKLFAAALSCDPVSAFGGITAFNQICTQKMAEAVADIFMEVVLAPSYTPEALILFAKKPGLRVLQVDFNAPLALQEMKYIEGGMLIQTRDNHLITPGTLQTVTTYAPDAKLLSELLFAWQVVKHVKSNAIVLAKEGVAVGIGGGQVSRVDAVELALRKAGDRSDGAVLASDAFFPFRDSIDRLAHTGVCAIIQPGSSVRDAEIIEACNDLGIAMVFTGTRCFRH